MKNVHEMSLQELRACVIAQRAAMDYQRESAKRAHEESLERYKREVQTYKAMYPALPRCHEYEVRIMHKDTCIISRMFRCAPWDNDIDLYRFMERCRVLFYGTKNIRGEIIPHTYQVQTIHKVG